MASSGDKLSPLFKSLLPDESHLKSAAAATVQEAEQRWPLFRAIAPAKPATAPELTDNERLNWASPVLTGAPAPKVSLPEMGLNEQLAQGLGKMFPNKPADYPPGNRNKIEKIEALALPAQKPLHSEPKPSAVATATPSKTLFGKPPQVSPAQAAPPPESVKPTPPPALTATAAAPAWAPKASKPAPAPLPAPLPAPIPAPIPAPAFARKVPPIAAPEPTLTPDRAVEIARPLPQNAAKSATATPAPAPAAAASSTAESLKSLFKRLEAPPEKPVQKAAVKKSSFLGRLGKR